MKRVKLLKRSKKMAIWKRDHYKCYYCNRKCYTIDNMYLRDKGELATVDHLIPRWQGGSNEETNLVTCCQLCNQSKEFIERPIQLNK